MKPEAALEFHYLTINTQRCVWAYHILSQKKFSIPIDKIPCVRLSMIAKNCLINWMIFVAVAKIKFKYTKWLIHTRINFLLTQWMYYIIHLLWPFLLSFNEQTCLNREIDSLSHSTSTHFVKRTCVSSFFSIFIVLVFIWTLFNFSNIFFFCINSWFKHAHM